MNIFFLSRHAQLAAQAHCDKHVVKMILEYAQLLSTAHRLLDGTPNVTEHPESGRKRTLYLLPNEELYLNRDLDEGCVWVLKWIIMNPTVYNASHMNHPSNKWVRANGENYRWLSTMWIALMLEYKQRYGKEHSTRRLKKTLETLPKNIPAGEFADPPLAMPEEYKVDDAVTAYQNFYMGSKARFARWTNRQPPDWFISRTPNYDKAYFTRTKDVAARAE